MTTIFTFHGIGEPGDSIEQAERDVWVSRGQFCEILDLLRSQGDAQITFDDGNASDVEIALPELVARKMTATFFVIAGRIDQAGSLGQNDIRQLLQSGMRIGSHGMHHRAWGTLSDAELQAELVDARKRLEDVSGTRIDSAACPFGSYGRRALQFLRRSNYAAVYTSDRGPATSSWLKARNSIHRWDTGETVESLLKPQDVIQFALRRVKTFAKAMR